MLAINDVPVTGVVYCRSDSVGVVSREAEAVILLEVLICSHTKRGRRQSCDKSPTIELWDKKQSKHEHSCVKC